MAPIRPSGMPDALTPEPYPCTRAQSSGNTSGSPDSRKKLPVRPLISRPLPLVCGIYSGCASTHGDIRRRTCTCPTRRPFPRPTSGVRRPEHVLPSGRGMLRARRRLRDHPPHGAATARTVTFQEPSAIRPGACSVPTTLQDQGGRVQAATRLQSILLLFSLRPRVRSGWSSKWGWALGHALVAPSEAGHARLSYRCCPKVHYELTRHPTVRMPRNPRSRGASSWQSGWRRGQRKQRREDVEKRTHREIARRGEVRARRIIRACRSFRFVFGKRLRCCQCRVVALPDRTGSATRVAAGEAQGVYERPWTSGER
ncbi:hypothetical protein OH76DRAFT_275770 [Lentinus brumalis]|uniref:Uncharacterized protein n=1 Tax=Lentinus brumalis TaxID=2498619 RepID=A0A371CL21_9APHY|nr:hypothetical protein OH76DRAFT_275770 [Polyporus brumalis]